MAKVFNLLSKSICIQNLRILTENEVARLVLERVEHEEKYPGHSLTVEIMLPLRELESRLSYDRYQLYNDLELIAKTLPLDGKDNWRETVKELAKNIEKKFDRKWFVKEVEKNNKLHVFRHYESNGELFVRTEPRGKADWLRFRSEIYLNTFWEFFKFHVDNLVRLLNHFVKKNTVRPVASGGFFDQEIRSFIDRKHWNRFLRICEYYSTERPYLLPKQKFNIITYNRQKDQYFFVGKGRDVVPMLGQFIYALATTGILNIKESDTKYSISNAFLKFFNIKKKDGIKFLTKNSGTRDIKYMPYFGNIDSIE